MKRKKKVSMKRVKEILRLHFESGLSNEKVANALQISKGSVKNYLERFKAAELSWPLPPDISDGELLSKLRKNGNSRGETSHSRPLPDFEYVVKEIQRPHVTRYLLWKEYKETFPDGLEKSQFYGHLKDYIKAHSITMKIHHKGGDKLFVDYSGDKPEYIDRDTGEVVSVEFFACSWGASSYSYAEATMTQGLEDWIPSHVRAFNYFGCVANALVPDNLKSGITKADYYDPDLNPTYAKLAEHYNTSILPARVRKPRDKAVVESNILHLQRFILGRLRNRTFFSLQEINEAIRIELDMYNSQPMQLYKVSRRKRFEEIDKPFAKDLPRDDFTIKEVKYDVSVGPDYHVQYRKHFYSVPFIFANKKMDIYLDANIVQIYHDNQRITSHMKGLPNYSYTTIDEHMPKEHQFVKGLNKRKLIFLAGEIGGHTATAVKNLLDNRRHPEIGFRAALGIINLKKQYPPERIEKAAQRAIHFNRIKRRDFISILKNGLDKQPVPNSHEKRRALEPFEQQSLFHENIRGSQYYN